MSYNNESPIPAAPEGAGCPFCVSSLIVQPSCGEAGGGGRCPAHSASQFSRMGAGLDKRVEISAPNDGTTYHQWGFDEPVGQMKFHTVQ